jgi:hypothetical protein
MKFRLPPLSAALLAFFMQAAFCQGAHAQLTIVPKTVSASSLLGKADGGLPSVTICSFGSKTEPCQGGEISHLATGVHAQTPVEHRVEATQGFQIETHSTETERAVSTAVSILFKSQKEMDEAISDINADAPPQIQSVNLFQLSETLEWRVEPGDSDITKSMGAFAARYMPANQVGVFASRTLLQKDENTSVKFDAGVNVDTSGAAAGKAGLLMAW